MDEERRRLMFGDDSSECEQDQNESREDVIEMQSHEAKGFFSGDNIIK